MANSVLVTGASGFIGGQTVIALHEAGYSVIGVDRRPLPVHLVFAVDQFHCCDFSSTESFDIITSAHPAAIIHCAGTSLVGPSILNPREYYDNNFTKTKRLLDFLVDSDLTDIKIVFSSSAAVYGDAQSVCVETDVPNPMNPYGESKRMVEQLLESYHRAYGIEYVALRYFNAAGADHLGRHGQEPNATHIIARCIESVLSNKRFSLYGNDYSTKDGTCERDYIHVSDLADAHILSLSSPSGIYNLGNTVSTSNLEIIQSVERISGKPLIVESCPKRPGDPANLTADSSKFRTVTGWCPKFTLSDIVTDAWRWYTCSSPK